MDGRDCEMAKGSLLRWVLSGPGSKIAKNSTYQIETKERSNTPGPNPGDTEVRGSSSYQKHTFHHVLDGLPSSNTMPPSKLCAVCKNMIDKLGRLSWITRGRFDTGISHVCNPLSLITSAQNGCSLCAVFIRTDDEKGRDAMISRHVDEWKARFGDALVPCSRVFVHRHASRYFPPSIVLKFATDPHWTDQSSNVLFKAFLKDPPEMYNQVFENINASSNTRQSIPLIKNWLNACQRIHPKCKAQRPEFTPTRLIDLQGKHPKLCLGSLIEKKDLQYATLSHCWGVSEKKYQTLNKSNLRSYLSKLEMENLPKTFHDAIEVCMQLKIRYIWIDSLCIIQDDREDWKKESAAMIDVYGGCLLNIAASSSIDGSQGCFFDRKDALRCRVSLGIRGKNDVMYKCIKFTRHPLNAHDVCPLESRGWTLQERLLSPRTVHFTREEVFWECHTKFVSESSPFHSDQKNIQQKEQLSIKMWGDIIKNYSSRHLTYEADRLIALAGIAAKIQQQTKDEYFAGMWRKDLIKGLCWEVSCHKVMPRISPRRAPTWSWASVASKVTGFDRYTGQDIALSKVLKVEKPATEYKFGDMPNLALWLSCPPLLVVQVMLPDTMILCGIPIRLNFFRMDSVEDTTTVNMNSKMCNVYILRLFEEQALMLKHIEGTRGIYERIGFVELWTLDMDFNDKKNHVEETAYVPREKHGFEIDEHVICLL